MRGFLIAAAAVLVLGLGGCTSTAKPVAPSTLTPAEVVTAGKATVEKWRQAYELRSVDSLAKVYAQDIDLLVVLEGTAYQGWSAVETMLKERIKLAAEIYIRLKDVSVISVSETVATVSAVMVRETKAAQGATTVTETGTVTLVLRRVGADWAIGVEHFSYKRSS